jgi:hypothetical protein
MSKTKFQIPNPKKPGNKNQETRDKTKCQKPNSKFQSRTNFRKERREKREEK